MQQAYRVVTDQHILHARSKSCMNDITIVWRQRVKGNMIALSYTYCILRQPEGWFLSFSRLAGTQDLTGA